jgi:hypothetical protein
VISSDFKIGALSGRRFRFNRHVRQNGLLISTDISDQHVDIKRDKRRAA